MKQLKQFSFLWSAGQSIPAVLDVVPMMCILSDLAELASKPSNNNTGHVQKQEW